MRPEQNPRHQYDEERDEEERKKTRITDFGPSLTQQQFTKDVDLNFMVKAMGITDGSSIPPFFDQSITADKFGDFTEAQELGFRGAMDRLKEATDAFNQLPATIRRRFGNDPGELMNFLADENNADEAIKLGLLKKMPEILPEGVTTRRELHKWIKDNPQEAIEIGLAPAPTAPTQTTPK